MGYFRDGRVTLSEQRADGFDARAEGTASYRLWLRTDRGRLNWACTCPAAENGGFCKHLVAGALTWLGGEVDDEPVEPEQPLHAALAEQPAERLADWLYQAALDDPALARSLRLRLSGGAAELKKALSAMLRKRGFLDWQRSMAFAEQLREPLALLTDQLQRDPSVCLELTEYALKRLLKIYEEADDSGGAIGEAIADFAELHARAAKAAQVTPRKFADRLYTLKQQDEWDLFPLARYWEALGTEGQQRYAAQVEAEFASLGETRARHEDTRAWLAEMPVTHRYEELARIRGDFEALLQVLMRDLGSGHGYQRIVDACREFGHDDMALAWAQRGLEAHPDWPGIRTLAADELERAGRLAEARDLLWAEFLDSPNIQSWQRLRDVSGDEWPGIREKALASVAERERQLPDDRRDVTLRLELLRGDGDLEAARRLALEHDANSRELQALAKALAREHPADASALLRRAVNADLPRAGAKSYHHFIPRMVRAVELDPGPATTQWLADIRERYKARRKLIGLMDKAGLR